MHEIQGWKTCSGDASERATYVLLVFVDAALLSAAGLWRSRTRLAWADFWPGLALGLVNLGATHTLLLALNALPGVIVFPVSSAVSIIVTTLAGVLIWRERLGRANLAGIVAAVAAVALINLPGA